MNTSICYIISQIGAVIAFVCMMISFWCKSRRHVLFFQIAGCSFYTFQYLLLQLITGSGLTGAIVNLIGIFRTCILIQKRPGERKFRFVLAGLLILYTVAGMMTWNGIASLFSYFTCISSTIGLYHSNTNRIRLISCLTCIFWMTYDILIGAYVAMIGEICIMVSNILSIFLVGVNSEELEQWR